MTESRLGVLGGTFDPPHIGHLVAALDVRFQLGLDRVLLVVANQPWQKVDERQISPASKRLAMVEAAVAGIEGLDASPIEIERGGPSYTADTLEELRDQLPGVDLHLVLGSDSAQEIGTWKRCEELAKLATLVVVGRHGASGPLPEGYSWVHVESPKLEVSSTDLRDRIASGRPVDFLIPAPVIELIRRWGLYEVAAGA